MSKNIKRILCLVLLAVIVSTMFGGVAYAADPITVTVRIQGYNAGGNEGIILNEYQVTLTDATGFTAYDALNKACSDNTISLAAAGSGESTYVSGIGGQTEAYFKPNSLYYSGWMFRVWRQSNPITDELPSVSSGAFAMQNGDKMTWYYAIPAESWYTCISNYSSIEASYDEEDDITVNIKAQKFTDIMNWQLTGFTNLQGAAVVLVKASDGTQLANGTSDANGDVTIEAPQVNQDTACYLYVSNKFFTSGNLNNGMEQVKSWRKSITIKNID